MAGVRTVFQGRGGQRLDIETLNAHKVPVQDSVNGVPAVHLGLGPSAPDNLALRKRVARPGAPYGGVGFFDPQQGLAESDVPEEKKPSPEITYDTVRKTKIQEFVKCAAGDPSVYYWGLQPIFDGQDRIVATEVLVRARNGTDSAPFEDIEAIMKPDAMDDAHAAYASWKGTEMVDWVLEALNRYPILQELGGIFVNVRPMDLSSESSVFQDMQRRINALADADRALLFSRVFIEITEDQEHPKDIEASFVAWKELGFLLAYDDAIGDLACQALGKKGKNFHTMSNLEAIVGHFQWVKVDIEWAGFALFLSHPAYSKRASVKDEILQHAREEDLVYVTRGPNVVNTNVQYSALCAEFVTWALAMIGLGKCITIELTVSPTDPNNAFALEKMKNLGLDIFGEHQSHFLFQGGPVGAKAFTPDVLAASFQPAPAA